MHYLKCLYIILTLYLIQIEAIDKRAEPSGTAPAQPSFASSGAAPTPTTAINTAPAPLNGGGVGQPHNSSNTNSNIIGASSSAAAPPGKPTSASYSNDIPPAYLTWKKPVPNQTFPPLFKIGVSNITFEWTIDQNMLKVQPANLTVALANPQKQTYTAAVVPGTATSAHWDLARIPPGSPLMMGYYTVWVYDQRGPKAFPSPGWLMPDSRLVVAMYSTEAYVGRTDSMFCPTCYLGAGGTALKESMLPWATALAVAMCTSAVVLFSIFY